MAGGVAMIPAASQPLIAGNDNIIRCRANPLPNSLTWTAIQIGIRLVRMGIATGKSRAQHLNGSRLCQEHPRAVVALSSAYRCHLRTSCLRVEDHSTLDRSADGQILFAGYANGHG